MARPTILDQALKDKAHKYVNCEGEQAQYAARGNVIPTIEDFAHYLGINRDTVYAWEKQDEEFSDIVEAIRQEQGNLLINKGLKGEFNSTIAKLILSGKHGYIEKSEQDITTAGEKINPGVASPELINDFVDFMRTKRPDGHEGA